MHSVSNSRSRIFRAFRIIPLLTTCTTSSLDEAQSSCAWITAMLSNRSPWCSRCLPRALFSKVSDLLQCKLRAYYLCSKGSNGFSFLKILPNPKRLKWPRKPLSVLTLLPLPWSNLSVLTMHQPLCFRVLPEHRRQSPALGLQVPAVLSAPKAPPPEIHKACSLPFTSFTHFTLRLSKSKIANTYPYRHSLLYLSP